MDSKLSRLCCWQQAHNWGASGKVLVKHSAAVNVMPPPELPTTPQLGAAQTRGIETPMLDSGVAAGEGGVRDEGGSPLQEKQRHGAATLPKEIGRAHV